MLHMDTQFLAGAEVLGEPVFEASFFHGRAVDACLDLNIDSAPDAPFQCLQHSPTMMPCRNPRMLTSSSPTVASRRRTRERVTSQEYGD